MNKDYFNFKSFLIKFMTTIILLCNYYIFSSILNPVDLDDYMQVFNTRIGSNILSFNDTKKYLSVNEDILPDGHTCKTENNNSNKCSSSQIQNVNYIESSHLHNDFVYREVDKSSLKKFLQTRNSLLEEEPYFSTIINTAKNFNVNPLLLFAITGQEQSFVPKSNANAKEIANNPFNVFNSWQNYNTDIKDSSEIASRTVVNLSLGRPENIDPFKWLNNKYSEDSLWFVGVKSIYTCLEDNVPYLD